ncbi:hypothetical protein Bca4012_036240 [Brassica carinata]
MNCEVCHLKELEVESFEIREVLRCILHTIIFHRALGLIRPKDIDLELFDITYVQCGEIEVEKKIDETIEHFISWIEKHPNKKSQTKSPSHHSKLVMDTGVIDMFCGNPTTVEASEERNSRRTMLEQSLQEVLFQIIKFVNEKKDHVPPINDGVIYCPFEITMPSSSDSTFGRDIWKRMLHSGGHPSMLS